jgi:pyruvate dehydrogenase E1 component alpha subunit
MAKRLLAQELMTEQRMAALQQQIDQEIEDAVVFARQSPYPEVDTLLRNVYAER